MQKEFWYNSGKCSGELTAKDTLMLKLYFRPFTA